MSAGLDTAPLRMRLQARERLVGTVVALPDVGLAELTAGSLDLVWIDLEHGALGARDVQPLAIAARAARAASLVRLRAPDDLALGPALDAGVEGVVVPHVVEAADAEQVVKRLRRPPRGTRGIAERRATGYGRDALAADPVCLVQVESPRAVENASALAAVDGVDALVVGCADLAAELGEEVGSERFRRAVAEVQEAAAAAGIASGIAGPAEPALLAALAGERSTLLVLGADVRIYARALDDAVGRLRQERAPSAPEREETHVST